MELKNLENFNPRLCISGKVRRLHRLTSNIFRKHLKPFDVTESQLSILFVLTKRDGLKQKDICDFFHLEKSSLNRNLNRLFDKNMISKESFPIIKITDKGKAFVNDIVPEWQKAMKEIRALLKEDGEEALNHIINKLTN